MDLYYSIITISIKSTKCWSIYKSWSSEPTPSSTYFYSPYTNIPNSHISVSSITSTPFTDLLYYSISTTHSHDLFTYSI